MKITVTRDDIRKGKRAHPGRCAVALAVERVVGPNRVVLVSATSIYYGRWDTAVTVDTTPEVNLFVRRFDSPLPHCWPFVRPFTFELA